MRDGYRANAGEMCFILSWFRVHQAILHSWGDISVLLFLRQCCWGLALVPLGKSRFLTCLIGNMEILSTQCRGIGPPLAGRWKAHEFSRVAAGTWGIFSSYGVDGYLKLGFVQRSQESCLGMTHTSGSYIRLGRTIRTLLEVRWESKHLLLFGTVILVFLSLFTKSQASSHFESLNSAHLSECQSDVRTSVKKRWRTMAFYTVSTGDSDIPSSCEMKDEPLFKPLQGKPAFFWVRASGGQLHLRQKTRSPYDIPISDGSLLFRCLWKVGLPLQLKTGNLSHPEMIWGARNIPQADLLKFMMFYTWDGCLRESL